MKKVAGGTTVKSIEILPRHGPALFFVPAF